jgi:hypothetical protein
MELIFFSYNQHIGDTVLFKTFIKKFCECNNNYNFKMIVVNNSYKYHNSFIFSDIPNLHLIYDNNYNFDIWSPINIINNNIYINIWIGGSQKILNINSLDIVCNLFKITNYYNSIIEYINNNYNTNYNLIPRNFNELIIIPYTNIDNFLEFKKNKKIIFYYNVYPQSGQPMPVNNHDIIIEKLADYYQDYFIVCCNKTNVNKINVINTIDTFDNKHTDDCENVAKNIYYGLNSDYIIMFDVGVCLYILNDNIKKYKGKIIHINNNDLYSNIIKSILNIDNYNVFRVNDENEICNNIQKIMDF